MKLFLTITSLAILGIGLWAGFFGKGWVLLVGFLGFAFLLFVANLDRISEFKASGTGIEAKSREVLDRAENTLEELQALAKHVGTLTLSLVKRSGRFGGYSDDEQATIKKSILSVLQQVGIKESEFSEILKDWHKFTEFDYTHAILGHGQIPDGVGNNVIEEWKELMGGINNIPTPEQIREFLIKHGFINYNLEEYLKDYQYYREHRNHRRPEIWHDRKNWGRLIKLVN